MHFMLSILKVDNQHKQDPGKYRHELYNNMFKELAGKKRRILSGNEYKDSMNILEIKYNKIIAKFINWKSDRQK